MDNTKGEKVRARTRYNAGRNRSDRQSSEILGFHLAYQRSIRKKTQRKGLIKNLPSFFSISLSHALVRQH